MISDKIRTLRLQLGMSQQQLAGQSLSRAYICLIEKGKATPSLHALEIIAKKLDKPMSYFLDETSDTKQVTTITILLDSAREHLRNKKLSLAVHTAGAALEATKRIDDLEMKASAQALLATCLYEAKETERALLEWEAALDLYKLLQDRAKLANCYYQMGRCAMVMEELAIAARYHRRALQTTGDLKSLTELRANILCMLGSTHLRLGDLHQAAELFQQAVIQSQSIPEPWAWAMIGLGNAMRKMGNFNQAFAITNQVMSKTSSLPAIVWAAKHNLAVLHADVGAWEQARQRMEECLVHYQTTGQTVEEASMLEEMVRYHLHRMNYQAAHETAMSALRLLEIKDSTILRARLYRVSARAQRHAGNEPRALELFQLAAELFRHLKASEESVTTLLEMDRPRDQLEEESVRQQTT